MPHKLVIPISSILISILLVNFSTPNIYLATMLVLYPSIFIWPHFYFRAFIFVRPIIDMASGHTLHGGINLAALTTLLLAGICAITLFNKNNLRKIRSNKFLYGFNKLFGLFLIYCLFSIFNAYEKISAFADILRLLSIFILVNYAIIYYSGRHNFLKLLKLISLSAVIPLCLGIYQFIFKTGLPELGFNRLYASFLHPNVFAQFLVLIFFILLYLIINNQLRLRAKWYLYLLLSAVLFELCFTYTRGAWIALFISALLYFFIKTKTSEKLKFIFLGLLILSFTFPNIHRRFSDIEETRGYQLSSWQWRLKQWNSTINSLGEHLLIGNGLGMYEKRFRIMAHNDYLRIGYETGLPGLFLYISTLLYMLFLSFKRLFHSRIPAERHKFKIALSLMVSVIIMGAVDNLARSTMILLYIFVVIGHLLGSHTDLTSENARR